jgi:radical SAM superfamily enzyme YgiQ (UPF0313 family)
MSNPICLITPPSVFLLDERVFINLGILKVAASLEEAGIEVEHLDLSGVRNYKEVVIDHLSKTRANVFGITATTPQMPAVTHITEVIREQTSNAKIILGGPHVTLVNAAVKREIKLNLQGRAGRTLDQLKTLFDVIVAGDGERSIFLAIKPSAPKLIDGDEVSSSLFMTNDLLNIAPLPARHLVDVNSYNYTIEGERALSLIAQLGCPFECGFCGGRESASFRRIRTRGVSSILSEIQFLYREYGVRGFMFYDDELNVNKSMIELMRGIQDIQDRFDVDFKLRGFIKSHLFTAQQAEAMYDAGFRWILVGFESGSDRILENINKKATREENSRCMRIARDHGLKVKALMSIGHPGESRDTVWETENWLLEQRPDDFDMTIITTYPGTPYYDHAVQIYDDIWTYTYPKTGDRLHAYDVDYTKVADYYKGDPDDGYTAYVFTDYLSSEELVELRTDLEKKLRSKLDIPFYTSSEAIDYEHSMGQRLPPYILRTTYENSVPPLL